ncbi:aspartate carbamoyltransferase [Dehalococcoidia bacterium]|nr:aspartate carbamoyltransferase [Dehalococcoidia bacterium]
MSLEGKSIISIDDLSNQEIARILDVARDFDNSLENETKLRLLNDYKLFSLFYEPSSRTFFSFREAMRRLGGDWDGILNAQADTSVAKGESLADAIRTFELMADVLVIRHPLDGALRAAQSYASKPLINGGDGTHEHPTQTLVDLYTIAKEKGSIKGQVVGLFGDLLHGRTVHSLAYALARFGAKIRTISLPGLGLPAYVQAKLNALKCDWAEVLSTGEAFNEHSAVIYNSESGINGSRQRPLGNQIGTVMGLLQECTALYVTRLQSERFDNQGQTSGELQVLSAGLLENVPDTAIILHPLPRRNEIAYEIDADKRAAYFRQMANSIPVRMAILALMLGAKDSGGAAARKSIANGVSEVAGIQCANSRCVVNHETYLSPLFLRDPLVSELVRCGYCDKEVSLDPESKNLGTDGGRLEDGVEADVDELAE